MISVYDLFLYSSECIVLKHWALRSWETTSMVGLFTRDGNKCLGWTTSHSPERHTSSAGQRAWRSRKAVYYPKSLCFTSIVGRWWSPTSQSFLGILVNGTMRAIPGRLTSPVFFGLWPRCLPIWRLVGISWHLTWSDLFGGIGIVCYSFFFYGGPCFVNGHV